MIILVLVSLALGSAHASIDITDIITAKKNCRQGITRKALKSVYKSGFTPGDLAEDLVEVPSKMIRSLRVMDNKKLTSATLKLAPWSDSYWPLYLGALANRYNDPGFIFEEWEKAYKYVKENPASKLIRMKQFDYLSPTEKYDYLFDLSSKGLTFSNWGEGKQYHDSYGSVETWMGLCHGWAAASIMMPEPKKIVEVKSHGERINFFPSDIKGLATLMWAKGDYRTRFVGGRCNTKDLKTDSMNRPLEEECLDNNPGTWHMAIVNQIGQFKRSFVMDATYDYEVWNQPVSGYEFKYYNPLTKKEVTNLSDAIVTRTEFTNDPRGTVRHPKTVNIVGIRMVVEYVVETSPSTSEDQTTEFKTADYRYDLELDANINIIGGEWYSHNHPDFLWVPDRNTFPDNSGDSARKSLNINSITAEDAAYAKINAKDELPYGPLVRELVELSK